MEKGETRIKRVRKEIDYDATSRGDGVGGYRVRRTRVSTSAIPVLEAATATKSDNVDHDGSSSEDDGDLEEIALLKVVENDPKDVQVVEKELTLKPDVFSTICLQNPIP